MDNHIIVLAAGKGTRMQSHIPKVLHTLGGRTFIERVVGAAQVIHPRPIVVVGHAGREVIDTLGNRGEYVWQFDQRGTGDAVMAAGRMMRGRPIKNVCVVNGDHPMLSGETLKQMMEEHESSNAVLTIATLRVPHFENIYGHLKGSGRIVRDPIGAIDRIVEYRDASPAEQDIREVNCGIYCFRSSWLWSNVGKLSTANAAHEFYLTDLVAHAIKQGFTVATFPLSSPNDGFGINTPEQLMAAEELMTA